MRLSRRSLLKTAARLCTGAGLALLGLGGSERSEAQEESEGPYFQESASKLTLGNQYYEVDFDKQNGAITRIFDKRGGGVVSEGNADGSLWAFAKDIGEWQDPRVTVSAADASPSSFAYHWSPESGTLGLRWSVNVQGHSSEVTVDVQATNDPWFDLTARVDHRRGPRLDWLLFPNMFAFDAAQVVRALAPSMPGLLLKRRFFQERRSNLDYYPGVNAFMDFIWLEVGTTTLALYSIDGPSPHWPARIGLLHHRDRTQYVHEIAAAIDSGQSMDTPLIRCAIGEQPVPLLKLVREHKGYDRYPSLPAKLQDIYYSTLAATRAVPSPSWLDGEFQGISRQLARANPPLMAEVWDFLEQDFHGHQPDVWPPAERYGGVEGFRDFASAAQRNGMLISVYQDPMWLVPGSHTSEALAERGINIEEVAVRRADGSPRWHSFANYDGSDRVSGIRVSPSDRRMVARLDEIYGMLEDAHTDLAYVDEVGADPRIFDFHPEATTPIAFSQNWLDIMQRWRHLKITVEEGWDRLGRFVVGFYGNTDWNAWFRWKGPQWGNGNWETYPMIPVLFRDKVLSYHLRVRGHAGQTVEEIAGEIDKWIDLLYELRYFLSFGYQMDARFLDLRHEEGDMLSVFGRHLTAHYADELLTDFQGGETSITTSTFNTFTVTSNWTDQPHSVGDHILVPGGVVSTAHDGSVTGGVFQAYNGQALTGGEHYLIEQRKAQGLILRQPMGPDTSIALRALDTFGSGVQVAAFNRNDELVSILSAGVESGNVRFQYERVTATPKERHEFEASISLDERNRENGLREVDLGWTTSVAAVRDGRSCRREVQMTATENQHGYIAFEVMRDLFVGESEADCIVEMEWWDGGGIEGSIHQSLGLVFDGAVFDEGQTHSAVSGGWAQAVDDRQWKTARFTLPRAVFRKRVWDTGADIVLIVPGGVCIGKVTVTNAEELERRSVAYYTIHDPAQGETLAQGIHLRGWTDATQPIADLDLNGLQAIYAWDADTSSWQLYSPDVPARFNTLDTLEQGRAYYVRVRNGQTLHWPDAPYGGVGFHLQPGRNLVCWLGTPDKPLTDAIAPLRGMKAEPLVSVTLDGRAYDVEESRQATEPLPYGQALWVEIDAVGPTRWLQF